jgi:hypothetical protein
MDLIDMSVGNNHTYIFSLVDSFSGYTQQPVNLSNNPVLNNNSTQQLQDYNRNQIHNRAVR